MRYVSGPVGRWGGYNDDINGRIVDDDDNDGRNNDNDRTNDNDNDGHDDYHGHDDYDGAADCRRSEYHRRRWHRLRGELGACRGDDSRRSVAPSDLDGHGEVHRGRRSDGGRCCSDDDGQADVRGRRTRQR